MEKLGKYEILAELGHGAMGVVYKARDPLIGRLVALKTINSSLVDRPDLLERFYQEAQSAGKLQHPNIVTIFELGKAGDTPFIAMEYLDGESLEKCIFNQLDLSLALKVGYIVRICRALEYAHKNRVVHRDVKPGNIMVNSDGVVKVVDFGIARLIDFSRTHTNMMIGTPAYMAPELLRKKKADARSDIWAVGVTFYELICYQRPFTGEGYDIFNSILGDDFPPCSSLVAGCPPEIDAIIRRMLTKSAADRYQTMEEVLLDLEPVWTVLRSDAASALLDRANEFYQRGDLAMTQETLRQARQIDGSNVKAKTLLEKVSSELRQREIQPILEEHLKRGQAFAQSRRFREAQAEAEAALELDSRNELAQALAAEVGLAAAQAQRHREMQQRIQDIRSKIQREEFTDAIDLARQTLATLGPNTDITQLMQSAQVELEERNKKNSLLASHPFSPTDIQPRSSDMEGSTESAIPSPSPARPIGASSTSEAPTVVASAKPQVRPAVPVLTPPPALQPQVSVPQEPTPVPIEKPVEAAPAALPYPTRSRTFLVLASVLALALIAVVGYRYRYVFLTPAVSQQPASSQMALGKEPQPGASTNPPATTAATPIPENANPVNSSPASAPDEQLANTALAQAVSAYNRRDYAAAKSALDQALSRSPQTWPKRAEASDYRRKTQNRLDQQQHLKQAQNDFAAKSYDAAKTEATQAIATPDGDASYTSEASKLIAAIPTPANPPPTTSATAQPAKSPEPPPKDFKPLIESVRAAIAQQQWDDAATKLNSLPPDQPEFSVLKQQIADGREDQSFNQKKGELAQAESSKNETALRTAKDYFTTLATQAGRHSTEARNLAAQIDNDLNTIAANSSSVTKSPSAVKPTISDSAAIQDVLDRYAKALDAGDLTTVKTLRQLGPSEEKEFAKALGTSKGMGFTLRNCTAPAITGDTAKISCDIVLSRARNSKNGRTNLLLNRVNGAWIIISTN